jgi:uridine kinase
MKKLICISGASGSGKSTLSTLLAKAIQSTGASCTLMHMDNYFHPIPDDYTAPDTYEPSLDRATAATMHFRETTNFDDPIRFDYDRLLHDLSALSRGETITVGQFEFATNTYPTQTKLPTADFVIIDGLFLKKILECIAQLKAKPEVTTIAVTTSSYLTLRKRRFMRDAENRGLTPAESLRRENQSVAKGFFGSTDIAINQSVSGGLSKADIQIINDAEDKSDLKDGVSEILESLHIQNLSAAAESQCGL